MGAVVRHFSLWLSEVTTTTPIDTVLWAVLRMEFRLVSMLQLFRFEICQMNFIVIKLSSHSIKLHPSLFTLSAKLMIFNAMKSSIKLPLSWPN